MSIESQKNRLQRILLHTSETANKLRVGNQHDCAEAEQDVRALDAAITAFDEAEALRVERDRLREALRQSTEILDQTYGEERSISPTLIRPIAGSRIRANYALLNREADDDRQD